MLGHMKQQLDAFLFLSRFTFYANACRARYCYGNSVSPSVLHTL